MKFSIAPISKELEQKMRETSVYQDGCPVTLEELRLLELEHYNFEGKISNGRLVLFHVLADHCVKIFTELFRIKFPIEKMVTIDEYGGDDFASMEDNNSSCFNFRKISGTDRLSIHSYGMAIDINPRQNPMISITTHLPVKSRYLEVAKPLINKEIQG